MFSDLFIDPSEEPPLSTNPFAHIPYDVLQYVLNPYLTPADRFNFNQMLEPQERIYKRFPKDYAICHQLLVSKRLWNSMVRRGNRSIEKGLSLFNNVEKYAFTATHCILTLFHFFKEPANQLTLRFIEGRKEEFLNSMAIYTTLDAELYAMRIAPKIIRNIRKQAQITCDIINSIPFERDVPTKKN